MLRHLHICLLAPSSRCLMSGETTSWQTAASDDGRGPPLGGQLILAMCPDLFAGAEAGWRTGGEEFVRRLSGMEGVR